MMRMNFKTSDNKLKLYVFAEPQMGNQAADNTAWVGTYKSITMLFSQRD